MRFWFREIAGWGLVLLGLYLFGYCLLMLVHGRVIESGPWTLVAIIVFRGGIHLLKVAVAARVCEQADARARAEKPVKPVQRRTPSPVASSSALQSGLPFGH
jgi:hypothetical protein